MAVLNRCAVAVAPKPPMRDWTRPYWTREDMESLGDEESLYLIPAYDDEEQAVAILRAHHEAIFRSELELWCRDPDQWPSPRGFALFEAWFRVRLFPLVEDLAAEPLRTYDNGGDQSGSLRQALR